MDTRLLKMFCAVAQSGSLGAAGAKVHLTPSAISHGIKSLETDSGCRLFERAGKRLLLNQAGEQLLAQIQAPLTALDAAAESIRRLGKWGLTRLRIGAGATACQYLLPGVIRALKQSHPNLELRVQSGDTMELVELLRAHQADLALGVAPDDPAGLVVRPVFRDELMFVFSAAHPWAAGRPLTPDDLRTQPFILYSRSSLTTRRVDDFFRRLNLVPTTIMEIGSIEAIKELMKLNLGVSVLAPWTAEKELVRGTLRVRPLGAQPVRREWVILSLAGRALTLTEEDFCRLCRTHAAGMRLDRRDVSALKR